MQNTVYGMPTLVYKNKKKYIFGMYLHKKTPEGCTDP